MLLLKVGAPVINKAVAFGDVTLHRDYLHLRHKCVVSALQMRRHGLFRMSGYMLMITTCDVIVLYRERSLLSLHSASLEAPLAYGAHHTSYGKAPDNQRICSPRISPATPSDQFTFHSGHFSIVI